MCMWGEGKCVKILVGMKQNNRQTSGDKKKTCQVYICLWLEQA